MTRKAAAPDLTGIVGDWIVCISVSAARWRPPKLIKGRRCPPPPQTAADRLQAGGLHRRSCRGLKVPPPPPPLRRSAAGAALQKDGQNQQKSMDAQLQQRFSGRLISTAASESEHDAKGQINVLIVRENKKRL